MTADNLTSAQPPSTSPTHHHVRRITTKAKRLWLDAPFQNGTATLAHHRNSNVLKILPVTTLRTIDLGSKKYSGSLFSIF
jgi:hypothetical protein